MNILHLEDSENDAALVEELVLAEWPGCQIIRVTSRAEFQEALGRGGFDLMLSDFSLPDFNGLAALDMVRKTGLEKPFIYISGTIGEERAIEAMRRGAADFVMKDRPGRLIPAIRNALARDREAARHRQAVEQLREQAALIDKARDAIIATDLDERITYWNASACRLYGWTAAEVSGRKLGELGLGFDAVRFAGARAQVLATGEWRGDFRLRSRTGASLQVESTWSLVLGGDGLPRSILLIDTDVTEKKKLEARLLQADRMDSIGMLAGGVAHDLNNVLAPIVLGAEMLRMSRSEDPGATRIVDNIQRSAEHGSALVKQLLAFAQGGEGELAEVRLTTLMDEVKKLLLQTLPKGIDLTVRAAESCHPIKANATQIKQVLLNLALNARDAMPQGGRLEIRAENAAVDERAARLHPGERVLISVNDTGGGIPAEFLEKIFDPFFTTKGVGKGTGLGLATVAGIVRSHGGFLHVESQVGRGTTFQLSFPALTETGRGSA